MVEPSAQRWFRPGFIEEQPEAAAALLHALQDADRFGYAAVCGALATFDVRHRLGEITAPVVAVAGAYDVAAPVAGMAEVAHGVDRRAARRAGPGGAPGSRRGAGRDGRARSARSRGSTSAPTTIAERRAAGMKVRREVLGDAHVDRATAAATDLTREFQEFITDYAWGGIWTRPGLDRRSRSMITLTALIARGHEEELEMHLRAARTNGLSDEEIKELILQTAIYCGVPGRQHGVPHRPARPGRARPGPLGGLRQLRGWSGTNPAVAASLPHTATQCWRCRPALAWLALKLHHLSDRSPAMFPRTARSALMSVVVMMAVIVGLGASATSASSTPAGEDGRIAFVRDDQVFTMNSWGGDVRRLTSVGKNYRPKWSPDGRRIAFIHEISGQRDVWVMTAGGGRARAVTTSGDVTSAGATWSPDGQTLAYGTTHVMTIRSTAPYGTPRTVYGYQTGGFCNGDPADPQPVRINQYLAWSPDGTRLAVRSDSDCQLDYRVDHLHLATGQQESVLDSGADCCGYVDFTDLFWGPGNTFGYTQRDRGENGQNTSAPTYIVHPGFRSLAGDTGGAPSPSGVYMALTTTSSGTAMIVRAKANGYGRVVLAQGYQPDWQVRTR